VERDAEGNIQPSLAQSWAHSDDYREWTVRLRPDAVWEDGFPVTATDVKFTFDFQEVLQYGSDAYETEAVDDTTFRIRYHEQAASPLDDWRTILPARHLGHLDPIDISRHEWFRRPVSAGPYRLVRSDPGLMMVFERNPGYFGAQPSIERVIVKFSTDADVQELLSGQADIAPETPPHDALKYGNDPRFERYYRIYTSVQRTVFWNLELPLFRSPETRRALAEAIDRREIMDALDMPEGLPVFDVLVHPTQYWSGALPAPVPHDPESARRILEEAGWTDRDGDGARDRDGQPFRFEALVPIHPGMPEAAVYVQASLRRVGIDMQILNLDFAEVERRMVEGKFEASFFLLQQERLDRGHARLFGENSMVGYRNPVVAELLGRVDASMDPIEIDSLYRETWPELMADLPAVFLHPTVWVTVANRRVKGLSTPFRSDPAQYMSHLWIDDRQGDESR
jgi:peptide/nickel transport system substrate-binding protein